jgi:hypothetical protein
MMKPSLPMAMDMSRQHLGLLMRSSLATATSMLAAQLDADTIGGGDVHKIVCRAGI